MNERNQKAYPLVVTRVQCENFPKITRRLNEAPYMPFGHRPTVKGAQVGARLLIFPPFRGFPPPAALLALDYLLITSPAFVPAAGLIVSIGQLDPRRDAFGILFNCFAEASGSLDLGFHTSCRGY